MVSIGLLTRMKNRTFITMGLRELYRGQGLLVVFGCRIMWVILILPTIHFSKITLVRNNFFFLFFLDFVKQIINFKILTLINNEH